MGKIDDLDHIYQTVQEAGTQVMGKGQFSDTPTRTWDCGALAFAWRVGPRRDEIRAEVTAVVSSYLTPGAQEIADKPVRLEISVQARRVKPRRASEPIRVWTDDLDFAQSPDYQSLLTAFERASKIAEQLISTLERAAPASAG